MNDVGEAIMAARALLERLRDARKRLDEKHEALNRLAEELSTLPDGEAWARPLYNEDPNATDQRVFWWNFMASGPRTVVDSNGVREHRGATYGVNHERAPKRGEKGQWFASLGVAVSGVDSAHPEKRSDGEPKNLEIGKRLEVAWKENDASMREVSALSNEYESLIRSIVEAP